jgi:hypothetical protein
MPFDRECFYLAEYFFSPDAPKPLLDELAQRIQDQVEASPELDAWLEQDTQRRLSSKST